MGATAVSYVHRERSEGPKKMLSLDGGGIRGVLTLEVLAGLERMLRDRGGHGEEFRLSDYFDYIAGTSTGAIIAAGLALGKPVDELQTLYKTMGPDMFKERLLPLKFWSKYKDGPLRKRLQEVFGATATFGDERLQTLLLCVLQNATTDSPWPLSNCSTAKYNDRSRDDCNLKIPLWQVVRASTAAPTFFPPEKTVLGKQTFLFQDGGVTPYNNPAFLLFVMATTSSYTLKWPVGERNLLLVSVGTGSAAASAAKLDRGDVNLVYAATHLPSFFMNGSAAEQDRLCRTFGRCRHGELIDSEVGTMLDELGPTEPLFTYLRYNADISQSGLIARGLGHINARDVGELDSTDHISELAEIGRSVAEEVTDEHFAGF